MEGWAPPSLVAYIGDWTSDNFPSPTTAALVITLSLLDPRSAATDQLGFGVVAAATAIGVAAAMSRSKKNKERRHD